MADKTWKRVEREKCRELGSERSGPTGRDTPDCAGTHVALEIKSYKNFVFLTKDWQQAKDNAAKVGKPPVLAVKERGRNGRDIVQMREADWVALEFLREIPPILNLGAVPGAPIQLVPAGELSLHEHDGEPVIRMPWDYFVALYRAAFTNEEE